MDVLLPAYGTSTLAEVMPSIAAHLLPGIGGAVDSLGLDDARRYVLVMVDGLGLDLLTRQRHRAPFLSEHLDAARVLTSAIPSTTATSLTTLGTGLAPGEHGMVGYSFRSRGTILNALAWDDTTDPLGFQPNPTWFERLSRAGVTTATVSLDGFADSGLTLAGLRGSRFVGLTDEADDQARVGAVCAALELGQPGFVYVYERRLDHTGHSQGCASTAWSQTLDTIDAWIEELHHALPPQTCLLVTGDHGMIDVAAEETIMIEDDPRLSTGLDLIGGEGRLRQLYTAQPDQVAQRWSDVLGERAIVRTREQAIAEGWFGPVAAGVRERIGDVVVAMVGHWAVMTWTKPGELSLVGQHGSLTPAEMRVPLVAVETV